MTRFPETDHTAALALALQASHDLYRAAPTFSLTEAGLAAALRPVLYAEPAGPNAQGFLAIGEIQDRLRQCTGLVLLHPETNSVRVSWVNRRPDEDSVSKTAPPTLAGEPAGMG